MPADYKLLMDAEAWAFVDRINAFYPPEAVDWPIEQNRAVYARMSRAFHAGHPEGVATETTSIAAEGRSIGIRVYRSRSGGRVTPTILYFHGGGFILGDLDSHDDICAELCAGTGFDIVSVDYRLAPEHTGTAAFDDAMAAFEWASANCGPSIVLAGESAGGTVAACVAHRTRDHPRPAAGQVLIYPMLGGDMHTGSYVTHAEAPLLSARDVAHYATVRTDGTDVSDDPRYMPLADNDFSRLPPTVIFTAECDPLSSDGETYRDRLVAAGAKAQWNEEAGLPHGYLRGRHMAARAGASFERIVQALTALGRGNWSG